MKLPILAALMPLFAAASAVGASPATLPPGLHTQPATTPDDLYAAVAAADAAMFDAYNHCDLATFKSFFVPDVEFYHDHGGVTLGRDALTESVRRNICGNTTRELVPDSLKIYPMDNYGAVEIGTHRFHHPQSGDKEPVGEAQFVQLWRYDKTDGSWKITRVISFDHHVLEK